MTSYTLGNNTSALVVGVSELNGVPTPFISAVDTFKLGEIESSALEGKDKCENMVKRIHEAGGVVIYIHNPTAATNLHGLMASIFEHTSQGTWGVLEYEAEKIQ